MNRLSLLLVNPNNRKQMYGELGPSFSAIEPPVWTGLLAAFIHQKGFSVEIIDAVAENLSPEETAKMIGKYNPLLVGIGAIGANPSASSTPKMPTIRKILNLLKDDSSHIKTFLYGIHPSALPERTLREERPDFVCRGESFYTILRLLEALKSSDDSFGYDINGLWYMRDDNVIKGGWGELLQDVDELPFVAWNLLPMDKYRAHNWHCFGHINQRQAYAAIYTSLGCPFDCSYCNIHTMYNGKPGIRFRSIKKVVEEIDFLVEKYNIRNLKLLDEIFVLKESRVEEFCDLIIERKHNLNIWAYARVDTVNENTLKKMHQAGVNWLCYGIESVSKKVRSGVAKGRFEQNIIKKTVEMTHNSGIYALGNFMFGLPDDNLETMQETLDMAKELNCEYVNFYTTMAYPGSRLYSEAIESGIKLPDNWAGYSQLGEEAFPLPTKYLSNTEVLSFRDRAFEEYYNNPSYLKMIEDKFGPEVVRHISRMLRHKINRKMLINICQ